MLKANYSYIKFNGNILLMVLFLIAYFYMMSSCVSLQKTPGYKHYQENTDWRIRKL